MTLEERVGDEPAFSETEVKTSTEWWAEVLSILEPDGLVSRPEYYSEPSEIQPGEWANVITKAFERTEPNSPERKNLIALWGEAGFISQAEVDSGFWQRTALEDLGEDLQNLKNAAEQRLPNLIGVENVAAVGSLAQPIPGGMFSGGEIVRIDRPGSDPLWGMKYIVPGGIEHIYTFDSPEALDAALGAGAPVNQGFTIVQEADVNDGDTWIMGDAAMFAGQEGSYNAFWDDLVTETGLRAGIRDPGRLGRFMSDPTIARLTAESAQAGWSPQQLLAEVRQTTYYTETLYPGIESFFKQGVDNPEATWKQYAGAVDSGLRLLGYERDEDGTFGSTIGRMLDEGIEDSDFANMAPLFKRAQDNPELLTALNAQLDRPITFDDLFDVLAGLDTGELADATERAIIQFHANQRGTQLEQGQITRLANLSQLSEDEIARAFTSEEEALLALGPKGLRTTGLSEQDLIAAAFDIQAESGLTAVEIRRLAKKGITERGLSDDPKAQFFQSFTPEGRPFRPGLLAGAPEAG